MAGSHRRRRNGPEGGDDAFWLDAEQPEPQQPQQSRTSQAPHRHLQPPAEQTQPERVRSQPALPPSRTRADAGRAGGVRHGDDPTDNTGPIARTATGWRIGGEEVSDLTSAMVLADLLAADLPTESMPAIRPQSAARPSRSQRQAPPVGSPDARQLQQTVAQLEHALTARVRVEQAIGVLAERHRLHPRQAFELLRSAARTRGRRVLEMATDVVDSASNPLLRIPEELAKPPSPRRRGRMPDPTLGSG
jgi:hypothetical protein